MKTTAEAQRIITAGENKKFHRILGVELAVALETTLEVDSGELNFDPEFFEGGRPSQDLIFLNGDCWRAYYPARTAGDITQDTQAQVVFLPWFSGPEVLYNRLSLRCRPITGRVFRWMAFARFSEEKPFGFNPARPYINLDFFSKRNEQFLPLFVKVKMDDGSLAYFILEGSWSEDAVVLNIHRVEEGEAPPHLVSAKP